MLPDHARYPPQGRAARVRCTTKSIAKNSTTGSLLPAVPLAITPTFSPWTHTSDDSYIYQLSLVLATAIVSSTWEMVPFFYFFSTYYTPMEVVPPVGMLVYIAVYTLAAEVLLLIHPRTAVCFNVG